MRRILSYFLPIFIFLNVYSGSSSSDVQIIKKSSSVYHITIPHQFRSLMNDLSTLPEVAQEEYSALLTSGITVDIGSAQSVQIEIISESFEPAPSSLMRQFQRLFTVEDIIINYGVAVDEVYTFRGTNYARIKFDRVRLTQESNVMIRGKTELELRVEDGDDIGRIDIVPFDVFPDFFWYENYIALNKILIDTDGITKLMYDDIVSVNSEFVGVDTSFLRIIHHGTYIPFTVQTNNDGEFGPGAAIYFPADRAYKDRFIFEPDEHQIEGVYWLALSPDPSEPPNYSQPDTSDTTYTTTRGIVRWEQRSIFHPGNGPAQYFQQSDDIPGIEYFSTRDGDFGRGWYSGRLRRNQFADMIFNFPNLAAIPEETISIVVHVQSSTARQEPLDVPDHHLRFELNGTIIYEIQFNGYEKQIISIEADADLLTASQNVLRLRSLDTGKSVNEVLYDYVVIDYPKNLHAEGGHIEFFASGEGELVAFEIDGFTSDAITGFRYRKTEGVWIHLQKIITSQVGESFQAVVYDTIDGDQLYVLAEVDATVSPSQHYKREIDDLSGEWNSADYIILTYDELKPAAQDIAQYRMNTNNVRSRVVLVEDVFDTFAYGGRTPYAIREFFRYSYFNWQGKPPSYALMLGQANRDSRDYTGTGKENKLPALGNPVSDVWYVIFDEIHPRVPQIAMGRIPAENLEEAQRYISLIKEYENYEPNLWNKQIMLMSGGQTVDEIEAFPAYMEELGQNYVLPSPYGGIPLRVYKTTEGIGLEETEEIRRAIESGAVWISFFGHAAATTWDNGINEPHQLRNKQQRMHLLTDLSCNTARYAEPDTRSFAERFIFDPNDPAIGFIAHTGLGWTAYLQTIGRELFRTVLQDTTRYLGDALQNARLGLQGRFGNTIINRGMIHQYSLMGDPLTRISILNQPDLAIEDGDLTITPAMTSETDTSVAVQAAIRNYGLVPKDSVLIELKNYYRGSHEGSMYVTNPRIFSVDTVHFNWNPSGMPGEHVLELIIDPNQLIDDYNRLNNKISLNTFVFSYEVFNIRPLSSSIVTQDSVELMVTIPPQVEIGAVLQIEFDKHPEFISPFTIEKVLDRTGVIRMRVGPLDDMDVYYWRSRIVSGDRISPWSTQYFYTDFSASPKTLWKQDYRTFSPELNAHSNIQFNNDGAGLIKEVGVRHVIVRSSGFDDQNFASVLIDGIEVVAQTSRRGFNTVRVSNHSGEVLEVKTFDTWGNAEDAEVLTEYIENLEYGEYLLVAVMDEASLHLTDSLKIAFKSLGAEKINNLAHRDAYALVGRKGAEPGSVPEDHVPRFQGVAMVEDSIRYIPIEGYITSPWIGPGIEWQNIDIKFINDERINNLPLALNAIDAIGNTVTFSTTVGDAATVIDSLTGTVYLYIQLKLWLIADRNEGFDPVLESWLVEYISPSELTFSDDPIIVNPDTVWEGDPVDISGYVENIGYSSADSVLVALRLINGGGQSLIDNFLIPSIPVDSKEKFEFVTGTQGWVGAIIFQIEIDPNREIFEFTRVDNTIMTPTVFVERDTTRPKLVITFDDIEIWDGDYVSASPEILIKILDEGPMVKDTMAVNVYLNGERVSYSEPILEFIPGQNEIVAQVLFTPALEDGLHLLEVFAVDAFGNPADTTAGRISFRVSTTPKILDVYNYPNPFSRDTYFTFNLAGGATPHEVRIKIYMVAGRLVHELVIPQPMLQFGFNKIHWNGTDRDGDLLANGVYLYTVTLRDGDISESTVQRFVIMR